MIRNSKTISILLAIVEIFNGISAIIGGYFLISDKSGESIGFNLSWLDNTPFTDFLLPGLFLFIVNGLGNLVAFSLLLYKNNKAGVIGAILGLIMTIWIIMQVFWIGYTGFLQPLYLITGLIQTIFGFLIIRLNYYK